MSKPPGPPKKQEPSTPSPTSTPNNPATTPPEPLQEILEALKDAQLPKEKREELAMLVVQKIERYSGPIPHPDHFKAYNDAMPGCGERIFGMAEQRQTHDLETKKRQQTSDNRYRLLGLIFGLLAFFGLLGFAGVCVAFNQPVLAGSAIGVGLVGTAVSIFIRGNGAPILGDKVPKPEEPAPKQPQAQSKGKPRGGRRR